MNLMYSNDLTADSSTRSLLRNIAIELSYRDVFFDLGNKDVPAKKVLEELQIVMDLGTYTRNNVSYEDMMNFMAYVHYQIEIENVKRLMKKAAVACKKAKIRYDGAQSMFYKALEETRATEIDTGAMYGWRNSDLPFPR